MVSVSRKTFDIFVSGIRWGICLGIRGNSILAELAEKLAPTVEVPLERSAQITRIVGRGLHRDHSHDLLAHDRIVDRLEERSLDSAWQKLREDLLHRRTELV